LPVLAFELGFRQVDTLDSTTVRIAPDALESRRRRFDDKLIRDRKRHDLVEQRLSRAAIFF
jgi:hypothetical protein